MSESTSPSVVLTPGCDDALFQKRFEEGYDIYDEKHLSWLRIHHPNSIPHNLAASIVSSSSAGAQCPSTAPSSSCGSISDILVVPEPKSSQKRRMVRTKVRHGQRSKGEAAKENSGEGKVQRETTAEGTLPLPSELARKRAIKTNPPSGVKRGG